MLKEEAKELTKVRLLSILPLHRPAALLAKVVLQFKATPWLQFVKNTRRQLQTFLPESGRRMEQRSSQWTI